jgi:hypothetical protein
MREIRGCLILLARLRGELQAVQQANIEVNIEFQSVKAMLVSANPEEFGYFCEDLFEKASAQQMQSAAQAVSKRIRAKPNRSFGS